MQCARTRGHTHVRPEVDAVSSLVLSAVSFETGSLTEPSAHCLGEAGLQASRVSCLCHLSTGVYWGQDAGPHANSQAPDMCCLTPSVRSQHLHRASV